MRRSTLAVTFAVIVAVVAVSVWLRTPQPLEESSTPTEGGDAAVVPDTVISDGKLPNGKRASPHAAYARSDSCRECHRQVYDAWSTSHHALAERELTEDQQAAFVPEHTIHHGSQTSKARQKDSRFELVTMGIDGKPHVFRPERVFGVAPLYQFIIPQERGHAQVTELAFDPLNREWFNVYGDEDRKAGEWGHWTGRGMNWNSMCAACHNTHLLKRYDESTDSYDTTMSEMGVGCESCHGPMKDHVEWQRSHGDSPGAVDKTIKRFEAPRILDTCGSCHSRRIELTDGYQPGEPYADHYIPQLPGISDIYYPDGQVREEDFEYTSFLGSFMHSKGVLCINCHDPHSGKTRFEGNALCMQCHKEKIDPGSHSHHTPDTPGGRCVDCHMPLTTYMQRHPRRDHGFTIPDPKLTREHGVPNACNRCHADRDVDWAVENVEKWYGKVEERRTQKRARLLAAGRANPARAWREALSWMRDEPFPLWRASILELLEISMNEPEVQEAVIERTRDPDPLVRTVAARLLDTVAPLGDIAVLRELRRLMRDRFRAVRTEAAWSLRRELDPASPAGQELWNYLKLQLDQPNGNLRMGIYNMDRDRPQAALPYLRRAVHWDGGSPAFRQALAIVMSRLGNDRGAVRELEIACKLAPDDPLMAFYLALALAEVKDLEGAVENLRRAVTNDPTFGRAWYNLALTLTQLKKPREALESLDQLEALLAESDETVSADILFARSTILHQLKRDAEAISLAERALEVDPEREDIRRYLNYLEGKEEAPPTFDR
jgi:predicted CXXCH cytochrome family protein